MFTSCFHEVLESGKSLRLGLAAHPSGDAAFLLLKLKGIPHFPLPNSVKCNPCQAPESGWEKGFRHKSSMACSILTMLKNKKSGFTSQAPKRKHPLSVLWPLQGPARQQGWTFYLGHLHNSWGVCPASVGSFCLDRRGDKVAGPHYPHALLTRMEGILHGSAISCSVFNYDITNEPSIPTSRISIIPKRAGVVWNRETRGWQCYMFNPWVYI